MYLDILWGHVWTCFVMSNGQRCLENHYRIAENTIHVIMSQLAFLCRNVRGWAFPASLEFVPSYLRMQNVAEIREFKLLVVAYDCVY